MKKKQSKLVQKTKWSKTLEYSRNSIFSKMVFFEQCRSHFRLAMCIRVCIKHDAVEHTVCKCDRTRFLTRISKNTVPNHCATFGRQSPLRDSNRSKRLSDRIAAIVYLFIRNIPCNAGCWCGDR